MTIVAVVSRDRSSVAPTSGVLAVMPFRVAGGDSAYGWLRDGMAELLTVRLSGEGGMRVADPGRVLRAWNREIAADRRGTSDAAEHVATNVNATRIIDGSVTGTSRHVVISASILSMPGSRVAARASVDGPPDSLLFLVDRLATQLLGLSAGVEPRRLTALTSTTAARVPGVLGRARSVAQRTSRSQRPS